MGHFSVLYITIMNNASFQELMMQGLEERLENHISIVKRNILHTFAKYILQLPKYHCQPLQLCCQSIDQN